MDNCLPDGAATILSAKYLARRDSDTVGILACRVQGRTNLEALACLFRPTVPPVRYPSLVLKEAVKALRACSEKPVALHLGKTWDLTLLASFVSTMNELNVDYQVVCFSFYPAAMGLSLDHLKSLKTLGERGGKDVAIAEYAYPCGAPSGQFWFMNKPSKGYPLTLKDQALWVKSFLRRCLELGFLGAFYWSPELYLSKESAKRVKTPPEMPLGFGWGPMSLFDEDGCARPAASCLKHGLLDT